MRKNFMSRVAEKESTKGMSLLDKAKSTKANTRISDFDKEKLELVQAWLDDEVTLKQVNAALDDSAYNSYVFLALGSKAIYRIIKDK